MGTPAPAGRLGDRGRDLARPGPLLEPLLLACPRWWTPGVVIIGDAAHFFGPETGVSSGIGLGDAHALAEAIAQNPGDPDAACLSYETWRAPAVRPYEANDPGRAGRAWPGRSRRGPRSAGRPRPSRAAQAPAATAGGSTGSAAGAAS